MFFSLIIQYLHLHLVPGQTLRLIHHCSFDHANVAQYSPAQNVRYHPPTMQQTKESNHFHVCYRERVVQQGIGAPANAACRHFTHTPIAESLATQLTSIAEKWIERRYLSMPRGRSRISRTCLLKSLFLCKPGRPEQTSITPKKKSH